MKRLVYVLHHPVFGGAHNQARILIPELAQRGWSTLALLSDESGTAAGRLQSYGVRTVLTPLHRMRAGAHPMANCSFLAHLLPEINQMRAILRRVQPELVLVAGAAYIQAGLAASLEGIPLIWQILDTRAPPFVRRGLMALVTRAADVVMTAGWEVARLWPNTGRLESRLLPFWPAVDTRLFAPDSAQRDRARLEFGMPTDSIVVGNVGNLIPAKGHDAFLEAAAKLRLTHPDARFVILGAENDQHPRYKLRLHRRALDLGFRFDGDLVIRDPGLRVRELAAAFDVFWLTSRPLSEATPGVICEAMALGLPVISFDVGAVREMIEEGKTGYAVPSSAGPPGLAARTLPLLADARLRSQLGEQARARSIASFNVDRCLDRHLDAFDLAIAHRASRARAPEIGGDA